MQVIIYKQDNGIVAIIRPTDEAIDKYGIEAIALKDVPYGKPFKIVDSSELPENREYRDSWTVDDYELNDGIGADWGVGSDRQVIGWNDDGRPILSKEY